MTVKGNNLKLFVNEAEITSVTIENDRNISASVTLKINGKEFTTVTLSTNSWIKDTPRELQITSDLSKEIETIFDIIKKSSVISLERIQNLIE